MTRRRPSPELLQWFGVFGAPFAWAVQHVAGFALTLAACDPAGRTWSVAVDGVTTAITIVAAAVALVAGAAATASWAQTRGADEDDPPPDGRRYFLALIGIAIAPLFLAMILMNGSGVLDLPECRQS
jgi:heme/copper-type cytochrome/quinol oxidase subunit 2